MLLEDPSKGHFYVIKVGCRAISCCSGVALVLQRCTTICDLQRIGAGSGESNSTAHDNIRME